MRGVEHLRPKGIGEERSGPGVKSLRTTNRWTCGSENSPSPPTSFPVPAGREPLMTRRPLSTNREGPWDTGVAGQRRPDRVRGSTGKLELDRHCHDGVGRRFRDGRLMLRTQIKRRWNWDI